MARSNPTLFRKQTRALLFILPLIVILTTDLRAQNFGNMTVDSSIGHPAALPQGLGGSITEGAPTGGGGGGSDPDQNVPVDGGLSILISAGVAYGIKKRRDAKNLAKQEDEQMKQEYFGEENG